jgi:phosphoribosylamine-glycine ligase
MKILMHSIPGDGACLSFRMANLEGCEVRTFFKKPEYGDIGKGYIDTVKSFEEGLNWKPDLVIFDSTGVGGLADATRKKGFKVIGASSMCDKMEYDRKLGLEMMKMTGIKIPEFKEFNSLQEARKYVEETQDRFVLKPDGANESETTFVATNAEEMIRYIDWLMITRSIKGKFVLQKFVEGVELSTEMWFSNGKPIYPCNYTIEVKKRDVGNLGPATGCAADVVFVPKMKQPKIVQKVFRKIFVLMEKIQYSGPIDINCIITDNGDIYGLGWTPRFGYSAIQTLFELFSMPISEFFFKLAEGTIDSLPVKAGEFAFATRVHTSPYPTDLAGIDPKELLKIMYKSKHGLPVIWNKEDLPHIWPYDIELGEDGPIICGTDLVICEITGKGNTIEQARDKAADIFTRILCPNKSARIIDGADRAIAEYPKLQKLQYV